MKNDEKIREAVYAENWTEARNLAGCDVGHQYFLDHYVAWARGRRSLMVPTTFLSTALVWQLGVTLGDFLEGLIVGDGGLLPNNPFCLEPLPAVASGPVMVGLRVASIAAQRWKGIAAEQWGGVSTGGGSTPATTLAILIGMHVGLVQSGGGELDSRPLASYAPADGSFVPVKGDGETKLWLGFIGDPDDSFPSIAATSPMTVQASFAIEAIYVGDPVEIDEEDDIDEEDE